MNFKAAAVTVTALGGLIVASAITTFDVEVILAPSEESIPVEQFDHQEETIFVGNQEEASI